MVRDVREIEVAPTTGALVLVVGPSGAGKDTLISYAREKLAGNKRFVFVHRAITRRVEPSISGGEIHVEMTEKEFLDAQARNEFALSWHSHGLYYGIPSAILAHIASGRVVVANVSRAVIPAAAEIAARRVVVNVIARAEVLAARLTNRRRETKDEIVARVNRVVDIELAGACLAEIKNEGSVDEAGAKLVNLLLPLAHAATPSGAQMR